MLKAPAQEALIDRIHGSAASVCAAGVFHVRRGGRPIASLVAWALRLPRSGSAVPVRLVVERHPGVARWTRRFGDRRIVTAWDAGSGAETIGPLRIYYDLRRTAGGRVFTSVRSVLRAGRLEMPLPRWSAPVVWAEELDLGDAMRVSVTVRLPWFGTLLAYEGVVR